MTDILFVCHRIPYPPDKGDKIRSYNILSHLAQSHRIHLGAFIDDPEDWAHVPTLREICVDTHFARITPSWAKVRSLRGFLTGDALNLPYYADRGLRMWVQGVAERVRPQVMMGYSSAIGQFMMPVSPRPPRVIMDFMDVDSDKWRQYADTQPWPMSWVYRRESRRLLDFDRRLARFADANIVVSDQEAALFRGLAPESADKIFGVSNGIDGDYFSPHRAYDPPISGHGPVVVFTGAMDYWPNVDAVVWFAERVLPRLREHRPHLRFHIVGSHPSPKVTALGEQAGVLVTGRVPDVRPYIAHGDVSIAPIRIARGIQNKVLEAMAMARPVIATPQAIEGIEAEAGRHFLLADDEEAFAAAVLRAVGDPAMRAMGDAARRVAVERYSWSARLGALDDMIAGATAGSG